VSAPRISVVTPSFNQAPFLERTIVSVLEQDYPDLEYMVLDAGSTDGSPAIIERYADRLAHWAVEPDRGQSDAITKAWERSTGSILAWLNSDDVYYPGALDKAARCFADNPRAMMVCGRIAIIDEEDRRLGVKKPPVITAEGLLPWGRVPGQPAVFLRREVFETLGGPRLDLHYVMDWEYWLRIALRFGDTAHAHIPEVLAGSREWGSTKTLTASGKDAAEARRVLEELFDRPDLPDRLRGMKKLAMARTWWRQSKNAYKAHAYRPAWQSLMKVLREAPTAIPASSIGRHALRIVTRSNSWRGGS